MRTIYLDSDFKCHILNNGTMTPQETDFFDGKCDYFIEGYRFVPAGETWTRSDGVVFAGEMVSSWKNYDELNSIQRQYEKQLLTEATQKIEEYEVAQEELNNSYNEGVNSI